MIFHILICRCITIVLLLKGGAGFCVSGTFIKLILQLLPLNEELLHGFFFKTVALTT